jgi:hypothetical protein
MRAHTILRQDLRLFGLGIHADKVGNADSELRKAWAQVWRHNGRRQLSCGDSVPRGQTRRIQMHRLLRCPDMDNGGIG